LSPDVTGEYLPVGMQGGKPYYELTGNGWFLWWNGLSTWYLSHIVGDPQVPYWLRNNFNIEGIYSPIAPATGNATVTEV